MNAFFIRKFKNRKYRIETFPLKQNIQIFFNTIQDLIFIIIKLITIFVFKMSQGFRKGNKIPQPSDTTGLTPPTRVDDQKNSRRAQQITNLHQEFQDLKKKIKQVQNKNQKIIQKIHKAYNFKKKNAYTEEYIVTGEGSPVVHFQNYDQRYPAAMSVGGRSNKSDKSDKETPAMYKRSSQLPSRNKLKQQSKINYSMQYGKTDMNIEQVDPRMSYGNQHPIRYSPGQIPPTYPQTSPSLVSANTQNRLQRNLVQQLNQQKQQLQQQLGQKQSQIYKLQGTIKNNSRIVKNLVQKQFEQFYQNIIHKNMQNIEKSIKRYEVKLKNIKKLSLMVKDKQQDKRSSKLLEQNRSRRSNSRSRKNTPPRQIRQSRQIRENRDNSYYLNKNVTMNYSREVKDESRSRSKLGTGDQIQKNKKQFQQIANKYEQLIKAKTDDIEKLDKKYRLKQRECYQLRMRVDVLQKRLQQHENNSTIKSNQDSMIEPQIKQKKSQKLPTQSNLLTETQQLPSSFYQSQISKLQQKIQQIQNISNQKSSQISNLQNLISQLENKNKNNYNQYQDNQNKIKNKYQEQQEKFKKEFQKIINQKNEEISAYRVQVMNVEKKFLEKECQYYSLESKIKKLDNIQQAKDRKIQELEKIVGDNCPTDRSLLTSSVFTPNTQQNNNSLQAIKKLKSEIQDLQSKLQSNRAQVFSLTKKNTFYKNKNEELQLVNAQIKKQIEGLQIQNQQLKINVNMNNISAVMNKPADQDSREQEEIVTGSLTVIDEQSTKKLQTDIQALSHKIHQLTKQKEQWYQKYQKSKNNILQKQSQAIKIKSQLSFVQKQLEDIKPQLYKFKNENQVLKNENKELEEKLGMFQVQFEKEREDFREQISEIEKRWMQFQDDMKKSGLNRDCYPGERSQRSSMISYTNTPNTKTQKQLDTLSNHNQYLTVKLKQAEAQIQTQKTMQKKILEQYQVVMEQYKIELKNKGEYIKNLKQQNQELNNKINNLSLRLDMANKAQGSITGSNAARKQQKNQLLERLEQLQAELKETKQINNKLTDMEGQLFAQIKIKEEELAELYNQVNQKQMKIRQLEQIVQVREQSNNINNPYGSHLSQSTHKRQTIKSQSSLKYSTHSQLKELKELREMRGSRMLSSKGTHGDKFQLELSQAGSQYFEQPSQISNISQFFQKQQLPYQKIKIKRHQQIKLFQKTASYIKSLKKAIEEKNKRLKLLQKKIQSLKSSQLVRKQLGLDIDIKQDRFLGPNDRLQPDDTFRDYQSVQLEYKKGGQLRRFKQLQHDTKLVMEQNNLLIQQIQTLQEQLLKAEQQQNSLVKIKDLYKQQIKKLIKKNQQQTKQFEQELKNQKKRIQDSQSVHNIQAIKQLFIKIIQITAMRFVEDNMPAKKKQQKRKEIQEYIKVMSNILKLDKKTKDNLLISFQK